MRSATITLALLAFLGAAQLAAAIYNGPGSFINTVFSVEPTELPGAELRLVTGNNMFGLNLAGMSALYIRLQPCTVLQPHVHPHPEFLYTIGGNVTHSTPYNNGTLTDVVPNTAAASYGGFAVFPAGQLHVTQNAGCQPADLVAVFPTAYPSLYFFPYTEGFLPTNTIKSFFGGKLNADALLKPVGTAPLEGCKCEAAGNTDDDEVDCQRRRR